MENQRCPDIVRSPGENSVRWGNDQATEAVWQRENERQNRECDEEEIEEVRFVVKIRTLCRDEIAGARNSCFGKELRRRGECRVASKRLAQGFVRPWEKRKQLPKRKLL